MKNVRMLRAIEHGERSKESDRTYGSNTITLKVPIKASSRGIVILG